MRLPSNYTNPFTILFNGLAETFRQNPLIRDMVRPDNFIVFDGVLGICNRAAARIGSGASPLHAEVKPPGTRHKQSDQRERFSSTARQRESGAAPRPFMPKLIRRIHTLNKATNGSGFRQPRGSANRERRLAARISGLPKIVLLHRRTIR